MIRSAKRIARRLVNLVSPEWHRLVDSRALARERARPPGDLRWRPIRRCPDVRLDAGGATIGSLLYVISGYASAARVLNRIDVFDMRRQRWTASVPTPPAMAQSHFAMACDGARFIYFVSGQLGAHCRPAIDRAFALDTTTAQYGELPPLPRARYAATAQLWNGRLHVIGGSQEDRHSPAADHWSLAVRDGRALDRTWQVEPSIPLGGPHRASAVLEGRLYVFGGQVGDWIAIPGDPDCRCTGERIRERYLSTCFVLEQSAAAWRTVRPMPVAASHTESSACVLGSSVYLLGGQCALDGTGHMGLTAAVQRYDARADEWSLAGTLPYRVKTCVTGFHDGWIYIVGGQRDRGAGDARPGSFVSQGWRAPMPAVDRAAR